jgi:serine/threonine protein kinase
LKETHLQEEHRKKVTRLKRLEARDFDPFSIFDQQSPTSQMSNSRDRRNRSSWHTPEPIESFLPVCKSDYSSLPKSCAAAFLSNFAESDSVSGESSISEGSVVSHYQIGRLIGNGAFSECREGFDLKDPNQNKLAFKIVKNSPVIRHEIEIWTKLNHPGFLQLIDVIHLNDVTVVVSKLASKGNMLKYLSKNGPFSVSEAKRLFHELSKAIEYMHNDVGIIHCDIKLDNILLDEDMKPYLCDFGLSEYIESAVFHDNDSEEDLFLRGSFWYLPPEAIDPSLSSKIHEELSHACEDETLCLRLIKTKGDVWALGVVLYAMVSGHLPFTDDFLPRLQLSIMNTDYPELSEELDKDLKDLVGRILTSNVESRPCINEVLKHPWLQL